MRRATAAIRPTRAHSGPAVRISCAPRQASLRNDRWRSLAPRSDLRAQPSSVRCRNRDRESVESLPRGAHLEILASHIASIAGEYARPASYDGRNISFVVVHATAMSRARLRRFPPSPRDQSRAFAHVRVHVSRSDRRRRRAPTRHAIAPTTRARAPSYARGPALASRLPLLPSATATLRKRPRRFARLIALLLKRRLKRGVIERHQVGHRTASAPARWFR